jgi:hypothetical protein
MRLTIAQLRRIIKEEVHAAAKRKNLSESYSRITEKEMSEWKKGNWGYTSGSSSKNRLSESTRNPDNLKEDLMDMSVDDELELYLHDERCNAVIEKIGPDPVGDDEDDEADAYKITYLDGPYEGEEIFCVSAYQASREVGEFSY